MKLLQNILIITSITLQAILIYIPLNYKLNKDSRKNLKSLNTSGKWFLIFSFFLLIISFSNTKVAELIGEETEKSQKDYYEIKMKELVTIYSGKVDSSYINTSKTFLDVTAKYGLHYDSINKRLENKIDTSKTEPIPLISLKEIKIDSTKNNNNYFSFKLGCRNAPANNLEIKYYFFYLDEYVNLTYINKVRAYPLNQTFSKDNDFEINLMLLKAQKKKYLLILVKGKYSTLDLKKVFYVADVYQYDLNSSDKTQLKIPMIDEVKSMAQDYLTVHNIQ